MRYAYLFFACTCLQAQSPDPAHEPFTQAYDALRAGDYDSAVAAFRRGIALAPGRPSVRKDLAYVYLKIGETEQARDQFREVMRLDPSDLHAAKEYAFLCFETKQEAQARRVFDRIRKTGDAVAAEAFENIDRPLRDGIERWTKAIAMGGGNFSAHFEVARLAERRDQLELAAEHYEKAWRLLPERRGVLVDLGRAWRLLNRTDEANAALLAASRGGEPRAAESARELLPERYPYVDEFRRALELDPRNPELRRELGYLLLRMDRAGEAEAEFRAVTELAPDDLLAATQLGFLLYGRGEQAAALPLFERVLAGRDEDLANRVRAVLRMPQVLRARPDPAPTSIDAKLMAERSIKAGYMRDALKYLEMAHEADPVDFNVMLKLGWTYNILKQDAQAVRWFDLARRSPDPLIAREAGEAYRNLRRSTARIALAAWAYPMYSSRWHDTFTYAQSKLEWRVGLPVRPYLSARFVGDTRRTTGGLSPQYLSESSVIAAAGLSTPVRGGVTGWFEAGWAMSYLKGGMLPDYRGGVSWLRGWGAPLAGEKTGWFFESGADAVFVSRFGDDTLFYSQNRFGLTTSVLGMRTQLYWSANATADAKREYWANFGETGPGIRFMPPGAPASTFFTLSLLRGAYTVNAGNPRRPNFLDIRAGVWYAFTR
jgi:Flp pilus assembly protein TadD